MTTHRVPDPNHIHRLLIKFLLLRFLTLVLSEQIYINFALLQKVSIPQSFELISFKGNHTNRYQQKCISD
jgi:hypothetical protein